MKILDLLQKNSILIDLAGNDKVEIITHMAKYMASIYNLAEPDKMIRKILEREAEMSTGIGFGIAIPHARLTTVDRLYMVAARSAIGIEFNAIDEQAVFLIFLMVSPANTSAEHTTILSSLSRIMSYEDMRTKLLSAATAEQFLEQIVKGEDKYVE